MKPIAGPLLLAALHLACSGCRLSAAAPDKSGGVAPQAAVQRFVFDAAAPSVVAEPVRLRRSVGSVGTFVVPDGAAAVDVHLAGGLAEEGGACGLAKEGQGTLRISGDVRLSGYITVYGGVLDLAAARPSGVLRVNLHGGARLAPPSNGASVEVHVNGERLAAGVWGPAGSAGNTSPALLGRVRVPVPAGPSRREIWQGLKYGIFSHYVWNGYGMTPGVPKADGSRARSIDELADSFDVPNYVGQLVEAGAQYVVFTAWHSGACPLYPSAAMDKWAPGRPDSPRRDLLGDLLDECRRRGVRAFFYCHPYQPVAKPHNDWINDLFAELVDRYGDRLDGLWLDENFQDCTQDRVVDYPRLLRTIKERNPELVLTHNNGGYQTYGVDEGVQEVQWEYHQGRTTSSYQIFNQTAKSPEDMLVTTVIQAAANSMGGGIQWSIDAHGAGGGKRGGLDEGCRPVLDPFVRLLAPIAESVKNTRPSTSYPPPFKGAVVTLGNLAWGVATRSADDRREYLHVLKPPRGGVLRLPPPADGKVFAGARLLEGGRPVAMEQTGRGLVLALPQGVEWRRPDTVIVLDVVAPGGVGLVNDTSRELTYRGSSWRYRRDGASGDYRCDRHVAEAEGDGFAFSFEGTDFAWIAPPSWSAVRVEMSLDGASLGVLDLAPNQASPRVVFARQGLSRGRHTFVATKRGGGPLSVDAFQVSDLVNDADPAMVFADTTRHAANRAALEGPWEPRGGSWINGHRFTFSFHGTALEVLGGSFHGSGDVVLALDGGAPVTFRCHGGQATRTMASFQGLANGRHTLVGHYANRHPAGFIPALDGFVVTRPDYWSRESRRGKGELGDDAHVTTLRDATGSLAFEGSGVEVHATREPEARTAHYVLEGMGSSRWVGLSHYSPVVWPGAVVFRQANLTPGRHTLRFTHGANTSGLNFSSARLTMDAVRVHKGESTSASPLFWGADGRGGAGTWDTDAARNWSDGASSVQWQDLGADDHYAVFAGRGGQVTLAAPARVNRLSFRVGGYTLCGQALELTGSRPAVHVAEHVRAVLALPVRLPDGKVLAPGAYTAVSHPGLILGGGVLQVEAPR